MAAATGVSTRALRYYEEHGLLVSERSAGGQRRYGPDAVERVRWIQSLYAAGLSSAALVGFLPCVHSGLVTDDVVERLREQRERIDAQLRDLSATRDRLDELIGAAQQHQAGQLTASSR
ncbi:MerR family transcriptional regulator [Pseudonocardia lacus]|uniref:MerR family transcriptional regulator n=1 Tax=Pseudonocardia lacus TaxID=2835865 RepID=UPI0027E2CFC9|nr:MerR family transcriptional regulator [Pseudonocardia lacus]